MKYAIAANDNKLDTFVAHHFGRCEWFCIYDDETKRSEFVENSARQKIENVGYEAASLLIEIGIKSAVSGRFGAKVIEAFRSHNVQMIIPETEKKIQEIIYQIK
ncbi:NifB/NifX family molybdenum-iron cluster-binding protein [Flammeovirgaceae bacterium SG7u.111]|nr:NifB/NifX family molybdenum-iron cluster-binding protein [Flammeovirgaceae bacterium SG7u.132]WPO36984.1 NifB/NifX family molybdenum-iron cluster-binding protein [Flammeovirgaceae bacterium SG7u.111]